MNVLIAILSFTVVISVLVIVHELGHYTAARLVGVKVLRFSVGFGRALFNYSAKNGTQWSIGWLPFGGYVKMLDERDAKEKITENEMHCAFNRQSVTKRIFIAAAGPVSNFLLAIVLFTGVYTAGILIPKPGAAEIIKISKIEKGSPAEKEQLQANDIIRAVNGYPLEKAETLIENIQSEKNKSVRLTIERKSQLHDLLIEPKKEIDKSTGQKIIKIGVLLQSEKPLIKTSYPLPTALMMGARRTWDVSIFSLQMLGRILIGQASIKNLSGPITIADYAGKTAHLGLISFIAYIALISVSLGVLNLLPIPMLDGGHLLYYAFELITGKAVTEYWQQIFQWFGFLFIIILSLVALVNDVTRLTH